MPILIKDIVPSLLNTQEEWQVALLKQWDSLVGSLKTRIRLEKIQEDTLIIGVYEVHWMQELYILSSVLIDSINQFLGEPRVKKLRFKLVEERKSRSKKKVDYKPLKKISDVVLTQEQAKALKGIEDTQLKDALVQFWGRCNE